MTSKKPLSGEDRELWERVKKSARPLKPARRASADEIEEFARVLAPKKSDKTAKATKSPQPEPKPAPKAPPPLAALDRRMKSRVARGHVDIGARIDLHGLTLERAHRKLEKFLFDAQDEGVSLALVITGKGRGKNPDGRESGALRREVPMWLSEPRLRAVVIGFEEAAIAHGGSGALYVRIRRPR